MGHHLVEPNPWMILPFGLLLGTIALAPCWARDWWLKHYPKVAYSLGAITLAYYLFGLHAYERVLDVGHEYVSFIALIGSLYVVSGGIHINVKGEATPRSNTLFLFVGALLANLLGTTGASMLLIRPWIRMNQLPHHRLSHCLLHLHRLERGRVPDAGGRPAAVPGLPERHSVLVGGGALLADVGGGGRLPAGAVLCPRRGQLPAGAPGGSGPAGRSPRAMAVRRYVEYRLAGGHTGCGIPEPPAVCARGLMAGAAVGSWFTTRKEVHEANRFDFHPIQEVAILFVGIFATMMPALDWLQGNAGRLGQPSPALFYWGSGLLSSLLDNAPDLSQLSERRLRLVH